LRLSIESAITPKTCKDFQKEEMISIEVIFFSINPRVVSRKVGYFQRGGVFRENGYLFEVLGEYSKEAKS
jgi:hypothetical protein